MVDRSLSSSTGEPRPLWSALSVAVLHRGVVVARMAGHGGRRVVRVGNREGEVWGVKGEGGWGRGGAGVGVGRQRELVWTGRDVVLWFQGLFTLAVPCATVLEPHLHTRRRERGNCMT